MGIRDSAKQFGKKFKLDSHHAIERFGISFGVFAFTGTLILGGSAVSAFTAGQDEMAETALYISDFTTSRTGTSGSVEGVYANENGDRALVIMQLGGDSAEEGTISYDADDYQAFLTGTDMNLTMEEVDTSGIEGSIHMFGSTGYMGVLLEADEPFDQQILNLTMRANVELTHNEEEFYEDEYDEGLADDGSAAEAAADVNEEDSHRDDSFDEYDQWEVFFNPGATGVERIPAMETLNFDPARAYYDVVLRDEEREVRNELNSQLDAMRVDLNRISSYTDDLDTTRVDGVFLRPPEAPATIADDEVVTVEGEDGEEHLELVTDHVVDGGLDYDWRSGNIYEGYLSLLVPSGQTYTEFLNDLREDSSVTDTGSESGEEADETMGQQINSMEWILSDGSDLTQDHTSSDVEMRPLTNVMNNLSQAYSDYASGKTTYQSDLLLELLVLEVELRNVQSNSSTSDDEALIVYYD